jgi:hypothetical protein
MADYRVVMTSKHKEDCNWSSGEREPLDMVPLGPSHMDHLSLWPSVLIFCKKCGETQDLELEDRDAYT